MPPLTSAALLCVSVLRPSGECFGGPARSATTELRASHSHTPEEPLIRWIEARGGTAHVAVAECNGLRGLVAVRAAAVGDVLLEVPLSAVIADFGAADAEPLAAPPPAWSAPLPWNVQLATSVLARQADAEWVDFLRSWPEAAPALPMSLEADDLRAAQDRNFETEADTACFWLHEAYFEALEAAEAAHAASASSEEFSFCTSDEFCRALQLVWSRCLRLTAGPYGVRRLLVPLLDMANHQSVGPSALFAYTDAARCGPSVRLYAATQLRAGDAVTITYGEHANDHFAQYYGFVPTDNPFDAIAVSLQQLLEASGREPPVEGWEDVVATLQRLGVSTSGLQLRASAPDAPTMLALRAATAPTGEMERIVGAQQKLNAAELDHDESEVAGAAGVGECAQMVADACATLEAAYPTSLEDDERELDHPGLSCTAQLLIRLRLERKQLLRRLQASMRHVSQDASTAAAQMRVLQRLPSVYPELDKLLLSELEAWHKTPSPPRLD